MTLKDIFALGLPLLAAIVFAGPVPDARDTLNTRQDSPSAVTPDAAPVAGGPAPDPNVFGAGYGTTPATQNWGQPCKTLQKRVEWRNLTSAQKASWISAVKCLTTRPNQVTEGNLNPKPTRYFDDFVYTHADQTHRIHFVAQFFPWHRWHYWTYYRALTQCGYSGPATYWAWELDWANPANAPPFSPDPTTGMGGTGTGPSVNPYFPAGAVQNGAFANWQLIWPIRHTLNRNFTTPNNGGPPAGFMGSNYYNPAAMAAIYANTVYEAFHVQVEGTNPPLTRGTPQFRNGPHGGVHEGIAGEMTSIVADINWTPNDPMFFLHHGNVDKVWWKWQQADRANRFTPGPNAYNGNYGIMQAIQNQTGNDARLSDRMSFNGLIPDVTAGSAINTELYPFCYTY